MFDRREQEGVDRLFRDIGVVYLLVGTLRFFVTRRAMIYRIYTRLSAYWTTETDISSDPTYSKGDRRAYWLIHRVHTVLKVQGRFQLTGVLLLVGLVHVCGWLPLSFTGLRGKRK